MAGRVGSLAGPGDLLADPRDLPAVAEELPGVGSAFDASYMAGRLQDVLFGRQGLRVVSCRPGGATYVPARGLTLRYELALADGDGAARAGTVNAELFGGGDAARSHLGRKLEPLARRASGHPMLSGFVRPVAGIGHLAMAVAAFPIDAGLPTLLDATDARSLASVLSRALGRDACAIAVSVAHYGRRHRCTLRYDIADGDRAAPVTVYGKVAGDDRGARAHALLARLGPRLEADGVRVPRPIAYLSDMHLLLLEAVPGEATIGRLLRSQIRGSGSSDELDAAVASSARLLAQLHACTFPAPPRRAATELAELRARVAALGRVAPSLAARLRDSLGHAEAALASTPPLPEVLAHGDFSHTQILVDRGPCGLLDFDTICRAEPALDLGHFMAYLRLAALKASAEPSQAPANGLCERFLQRYAGASAVDAGLLRARAEAYELLSLVRLAAHSWQKLKSTRLSHVLWLLEERTSCMRSSIH